MVIETSELEVDRKQCVFGKVKGEEVVERETNSSLNTPSWQIGGIKIVSVARQQSWSLKQLANTCVHVSATVIPFH